MTRTRKRFPRRRTLARWIDDLLRSLERRVAAPPAGTHRVAGASKSGRPALRLRRDLDLVLGL